MLESLFLTIYLLKPIAVEQFPISKVPVIDIIDGYSVHRNNYAEYAYFISDDEDFVRTMYTESKFIPTAVGYNKDGSRDVGIGQINSYFHYEIISNERYSDPYFQIQQAWKLYKQGTRFYGYDVRNMYLSNLIIK